MKCLICNTDTLNSKVIDYKVHSSEKTYIIKNTPIHNCTNCMEDFIDTSTTSNIDKIIEIVKILNTSDDLIIVDYEKMSSNL